MAKRILEVRFTVRTGDPKETIVAVHEFSLDALDTKLTQQRIAGAPRAWSFAGMVFVFADRFWQSVVLMGYFDKETKKGGK